MLIIMPTTTLLNSHDVVGHRQSGFLDLVPHRAHCGTAVVDHLVVVVLAGIDRHQERLESQCLQLGQRPPCALGIPPVDQAGSVEVAVTALLQVGHVLVVDPENALAQVLVGIVEQRQDGVGERQLLVDAVLRQLTHARLDVVRGCARQVVVLHEHPAEIARQEGLSLGHADHVRAVLVPDSRRLVLQVVGKALVEDVVGHGNVVVR
jgi:hypothetical protein